MPGTTRRSAQPAESADLELSVVIPCLNEADTIGICVEKAQRALRENRIAGEIVVADNGSTDGSQHIAMNERGPGELGQTLRVGEKSAYCRWPAPFVDTREFSYGWNVYRQ